MTTSEQQTALDNPVAQAVLTGLTASSKSLPAWLFYDEAGSRLFEQITLLPEYYLTRTERAIFQRYADSIIAAARQTYRNAHPNSTSEQPLRLLELGAGTATKTGILLAAATRAQGPTSYLPIDVSASAIDEACASIAEAQPDVTVYPQVANYVTGNLDIPPHHGPTLALYIGSSIGNFSPAEAGAILQKLRQQLQPGDSLLLGTDLVKDVATLEAAYCDSEGVTEAFNLNLLHRLNRELHANFDLAAFRHVAHFNAGASRIEMHIRSTRRQTVRLHALGTSINFQPNESIHTENSYKFTPNTIADLLQQGGFLSTTTFTDPNNYFAVTLAEAV